MKWKVRDMEHKMGRSNICLLEFLQRKEILKEAKFKRWWLGNSANRRNMCPESSIAGSILSLEQATLKQIQIKTHHSDSVEHQSILKSTKEKRLIIYK